MAEKVVAEVAAQVKEFGNRPPCVAFVLVGEHGPSLSYVASKQKLAEQIGIKNRLVKLPASATQEEIIAEVRKLAQDREVDGILVQSPLPDGVCETKVFNEVPANKDLDGFSAANLGRLVQGDKNAFVACTPAGVLRMLHEYAISVEGKHIVVIGRSLIVGRPLTILLSQKGIGANATVTACHTKTEKLPDIARGADVLISAAGSPGLVKADWVKPGATVIDVGITRVPDATRKNGYRLAGDVDFEAVREVAGAISPVPGGVGPMTVAMLMVNSVKAAKMRRG